MRILYIIPLFILCHRLAAQVSADPWIDAQLNDVVWQGSFKGVLADYHPITLMLASDHILIAGYLIHGSDQRKHRILGEWTKSDRFQLQERDEYDRLTGYLTGSITNDQVDMQWMSADQSRQFDIKAFPETLIRIKNFKPVAEWIEVASSPKMSVSVQKMDYGIVSGIANRNGHYSRFEGYCLDGTCSIWNTVIQNPTGAPIRVQMRQKDDKSYRATIDGTEYGASIISVTPLLVRQFDNSMGFLDFVYPAFVSETYNQMVSHWVDKTWNEGVNYLNTINQPGTSGRLVHRSSGWIEVMSEGESYISGMMTYINPGATRRETFLWLKKEDEMITQEELLNTPADLKKASSLLLTSLKEADDEGYRDWLNKVGYTFLIPTPSGLVMTTEFNMVYGDDINLLPLENSMALVKKKYWKYFGW